MHRFDGAGIEPDPGAATVWPPDEDLLRRLRAGDNAGLTELLDRYRGFARGRARSYFLVGTDHEDLMQEAMIGLYKAVRDYDPSVDESFRTFAEVCITRQVVAAIRKSIRPRPAPRSPIPDSARATPSSIDEMPLSASIWGPVELVLLAERLQVLQRHVDEELRAVDAEVANVRLDPATSAEIAALLDRQVGLMDDAVLRVKRRLEGRLPAGSAGLR